MTDDDPIATLRAWVEEARDAGEPLPEAMALATATPDGVPSVRMVLLRGLDDDGLRFFTHYDSRKGRELADNPHAAVVFHFARLERQVRVEGTVRPLSAADSDAYFASRPRGSQLSAAVSEQSREIDDLDELRAQRDALESELGDRPVPRPERWGGYALLPSAIELWFGREHRLHERRRFERTPDGWRMRRLAP